MSNHHEFIIITNLKPLSLRERGWGEVGYSKGRRSFPGALISTKTNEEIERNMMCTKSASKGAEAVDVKLYSFRNAIAYLSVVSICSQIG